MSISRQTVWSRRRQAQGLCCCGELLSEREGSYPIGNKPAETFRNCDDPLVTDSATTPPSDADSGAELPSNPKRPAPLLQFPKKETA
jgi:hypothetical protein